MSLYVFITRSGALLDAAPPLRYKLSGAAQLSFLPADPRRAGLNLYGIQTRTPPPNAAQIFAKFKRAIAGAGEYLPIISPHAGEGGQNKSGYPDRQGRVAATQPPHFGRSMNGVCTFIIDHAGQKRKENLSQEDKNP